MPDGEIYDITVFFVAVNGVMCILQAAAMRKRSSRHRYVKMLSALAWAALLIADIYFLFFAKIA